MKLRSAKRPLASLRPIIWFALIISSAIIFSSCTNPTQSGNDKINNPFSGRFLTDTGAPAASLGRDGDLYLDTATATLYVKRSGAWGNIVA
ncbi:MAG: hypothetical protein WCL50_03015, partial [Spirochaetota bacterium]